MKCNKLFLAQMFLFNWCGCGVFQEVASIETETSRVLSYVFAVVNQDWFASGCGEGVVFLKKKRVSARKIGSLENKCVLNNGVVIHGTTEQKEG